VATHKQQPERVARYITVQDAVERLGVVERTIRRWMEKGKLHAIHDTSGFVRLDLAEIEKILQSKPPTIPSVHQQIEMQLERIEALESDNEAQAQKVSVLQQQMDSMLRLLANLQGMENGQSIEHHLVLADLLTQLGQRHPKKTLNDPLGKRGLPPGTIRLVDFAKSHQVNLWDLKKLHGSGEIALEIYHREVEAVRNQQEWWVVPGQHQQIADYCQQHGIAYTPCQQCAVPIQEQEETYEAISE